MKTFPTLILLMAFGTFFLVSCKKDDVDQTNTVSTKLKTYIEQVNSSSTNTADTFNFSYDNSNRITSLISNSSNSKFIYTYNGTSAYTLDIMNASHLIIRVNSYLNSSALVDSIFQFNDTNDSSTNKLIYNSNQQLIKEYYYDFTKVGGSKLWKTESLEYDNNGNLIKITETNSSGIISKITNNTFNNVMPAWYIFSPYVPVIYKNTLVKVTYVYPSGNTSNSIDFAYELDNSNRIIKETQTDNNGNTAIKRYIYF